ncbi:MAG: SDR family NAD(P)-dependent oxidoreductase [Balneola sp.]|jgi:short-subunit dehydrogenase
MKNILITGATSGIGRELALQLAEAGNKVGLMGRRTEKLESIQKEIGENAFIRTLDVTDLDEAENVYRDLIDEMGGMDMMILNAGVGVDKIMSPWKADKLTIEVNVLAFSHGLHFAFDFFRRQGHGHIVGMSSIASHLASYKAAVYTASKHFVSNYMTGFRQKAKRIPADITVTDIKPGFVKSEMTENVPRMFWVADTDKAVRQMINGLDKKRNIVYITKRWVLVAWLARLTPQFVWDRI